MTHSIYYLPCPMEKVVDSLGQALETVRFVQDVIQDVVLILSTLETCARYDCKSEIGSSGCVTSIGPMNLLYNLLDRMTSHP